MTENILAQMRTVATRKNFPETELSLGCKISFTAQCDTKLRRYCGKGFILFVVSFQDILCVQKVHYLMGLKVDMHLQLHVVTKHIL